MCCVERSFSSCEGGFTCWGEHGARWSRVQTIRRGDAEERRHKRDRSQSARAGIAVAIYLQLSMGRATTRRGSIGKRRNRCVIFSQHNRDFKNGWAEARFTL